MNCSTPFKTTTANFIPDPDNLQIYYLDMRLIDQICNDYLLSIKKAFSLDTRRKLNLHKTFRVPSKRLM